MSRKPSDVTVTDLFCGAGGSSIGAEAAGGRLRMALNHWDLAIETHNTNFPDADHDCTDISATDPRRYPSTNILLASPECTNHSLAKGRKRKRGQEDLFLPSSADPGDERSRATMWDVPRFAEFHEYDVIICENVVDVRHWAPFPAWLHAMHRLGYAHQCVYLNSMFAHPTPQSRDRIYIVFHRKGNHAPDLEIRPPSWCWKCEKGVEGVQSWKPGRSWGRYQRQYIYCCPTCAQEVKPYYYAALNALDFSIAAERIGDRDRPLKPRTLERIQYGLEKYGHRPLVVRTNMTSGVECRVRDASEAPMDTQPGSNITALVSPFMVDLAFGQRDERAASAGTDPLRSQTTAQTFGAVLPPAFLATLRGTGDGQLPSCSNGLDEAIGTVTGGGVHHAVVVNGAALITLRDMKRVRQLVRGLDEPMGTQVAAGTQDFLVQRAPFLVSYYGQDQASGPDEAMGTLSTRDRHALIQPEGELSVDDCYFRMLQPHEIGRGMAFPDSYEVLGNKRDRVKQYGNAVTPPVMELLAKRAIHSLEHA